VTSKIIPAKTFPGGKDVNALDAVCAWLSEQCKGGFEPLHLVVKGTEARAVVSGPEDGAIVFVKK
jgi:hypothetical protein